MYTHICTACTSSKQSTTPTNSIDNTWIVAHSDDNTLAVAQFDENSLTKQTTACCPDIAEVQWAEEAEADDSDIDCEHGAGPSANARVRSATLLDAMSDCWVPHKHTNGVAVYHHKQQGDDDSGIGG